MPTTNKIKFLKIILHSIILALILAGINFAHYSSAVSATPEQISIEQSATEEENKAEALLNNTQESIEDLATGHSLTQKQQESISLIHPKIDLGKIAVLQGKHTTCILIHAGNHIEEHHWNGFVFIHKTTHAINSDVHLKLIQVSNNRDLRQILDSTFYKHIPHENLVTSQKISIPKELDGLLGQSYKNATNHIITLQSHDGKETSVFIFPAIGQLTENQTVKGEWFIQKDGKWTKRDIDLSKKQGTELIQRSTNTSRDYLRTIQYNVGQSTPINRFTHQDISVESTAPSILPAPSFSFNAQDLTGKIGISAGSEETNRIRQVEYIQTLEKEYMKLFDKMVAAHDAGSSLSHEEAQKLSDLRNILKKSTRELTPAPMERLSYALADLWKGGEKKLNLNAESDTQTINQATQSSVKTSGGLGPLEYIGFRATTGATDKIMKVIEEIQPNKKTRDLYMGSVEKGVSSSVPGHISIDQAEAYNAARRQGQTKEQAMKIANIKLYNETREERRFEKIANLQTTIKNESTIDRLRAIAKNVEFIFGKDNTDANKLQEQIQDKLKGTQPGNPSFTKTSTTKTLTTLPSAA